jgi:light-regulated signal transduction histidine kinase (bacteriophytochrome)
VEEAFCYCIIKDIVDGIDGTHKENGGKVIVGSMPKIYSISVHIKQIMQKLINNSLKYHQKDLPPIVNISSVQANDDDTEHGLDSGEIQIIVEDNEIGFDENHADSIFQPFRRFHGKSQFKGTG